MARKKGSRNKGYWFRKGRGWGVTEGRSFVPLLDEEGHPIKDPGDEEVAKLAHARYLLTKPKSKTRSVTLMEVCQVYLDHVEKRGAESTHTMRAGYLFNPCTGYPARFRGKKSRPKPSERIHPGYGAQPVERLTPLDAERWVDANPGWGNGGRMGLQALKRSLNYAVEVKLIEANPLKGMKVAKPGKRITYFTDEQEATLIKHARPALRMAIKVCIATGARPIVEFGSLEKRHIEETTKGQVWRFPAPETKSRKKERVIFVPSEIAKIVRKQPKRGKLFRSPTGKPWDRDKLRSTFARLRDKVAKNGVKLDDDAVFYSCRHTFAKRQLGKGVSLEILAGLMGNTPQVCWDHYAQWCDQYTDPLWAAIQ